MGAISSRRAEYFSDCNCFIVSPVLFFVFGRSHVNCPHLFFLSLYCLLFCGRPQAVMATGQVLFHRFYCKKSFGRFNVKVNFMDLHWISLIWSDVCLFLSPFVIFLGGGLQQVVFGWLQDWRNAPGRTDKFVFHRVECRRENLPMEHLDIGSKVSYC